VIPDRNELFKFREKDNPSALSWDEIPKATYSPWVSTFSTDAVIASANDQVKTNTLFGALKEKIEWINNQNDKDFALNINQYKEEQKELKTAYKDLDSLYKLKNEMKVNNVEADVTKFTADKEKTEKNKRFLNGLKSDIYLEEAVKVTNNMIYQNNLALNNIKNEAAGKKN
jgi:carboxyl-terminal processing protease